MSNKFVQVWVWIGVALLASGGAILAFGVETFGTPVGTTFGIAGVGLIAWSWFRRGDESR